MYPLILIYGNAGSGKDFVATKIETDPGLTYAKRIAFADPIKELLVKIIDWPVHTDLWGPSVERSNVRYWQTEKARKVKAVMDQEASVLVNRYSEEIGFGRNKTTKATEELMALCTKLIYRKQGVSARLALQEIGDWGRAIHPEFWIKLTLNRVEASLADATYRSDFVIISDGRYRNEILAVKKLGGLVLKVNPLNKDYVADKHSSEQEQSTVPDYWFDAVMEDSNDTPTLNRFLNKFQCKSSITLSPLLTSI